MCSSAYDSYDGSVGLPATFTVTGHNRPWVHRGFFLQFQLLAPTLVNQHTTVNTPINATKAYGLANFRTSHATSCMHDANEP
jgi:hypothetical protein